MKPGILLTPALHSLMFSVQQLQKQSIHFFSLVLLTSFSSRNVCYGNPSVDRMASIFCDVTHAFNGPHSFCAHSMISETRTVPTIHAQVNQSQL